MWRKSDRHAPLKQEAPIVKWGIPCPSRHGEDVNNDKHMTVTASFDWGVGWYGIGTGVAFILHLKVDRDVWLIGWNGHVWYTYLVRAKVGMQRAI